MGWFVAREKVRSQLVAMIKTMFGRFMSRLAIRPAANKPLFDEPVIRPRRVTVRTPLEVQSPLPTFAPEESTTRPPWLCM